MKLLWQKRIRKPPIINSPLRDDWQDTPETFPVKQINRKSRHKLLRIYAILMSALVGLPIGLFSWILALHPYYVSPFIIMLLTAWTMFGYVLVYAMPFVLLTWMRDGFIQQNRRIQVFVNRMGNHALGPMLNLLQEISGGREQSAIKDRVICNLKVILDSIDENSLPNLTTQQRIILCSMVDFGNDYYRTLKPTQRYALQEYSLSLTSSLIRVLGILDDEDSQLALRHRMQNTHSTYIYDLIESTLKQTAKDNTSFENMHGLNLERQSQEQCSHTSLEKTTKSEIKSPFLFKAYFFSLISLIAFVVTILGVVMNSTMLKSFGLLNMAFVIIMGLELYQKTHIAGIVTARSDSPDAIGDLLTAASLTTFLSHPVTSLLIGELSNDLTMENRPILNQNHLASLHFLLLTHSKVDIRDIDPSITEHTPHPVIMIQSCMEMISLGIRRFLNQVHGNPMPNVTPSGSILRAIGILGNAGSVRFLERYIANTSDPNLVAAAQDSLASLKQRLAVTPQEMLRASALPGDGLLQPASNTTEDVLLRPISTQTDGAVEESAASLRLGG